MSWNDTSFEKEMMKFFRGKGDSSDVLFKRYASVRDAMYEDGFFGEIKGQEPSLSDHSEKHIQDVFSRAYKIMGEDSFCYFNETEIYCLALMILFHDVGNIFGRKGHEAIRNIAEVYNKYRANYQNYGNERRIISTGASAHSGKSKSGNKDTLKDLNDDNLDSNLVRLRELSSILRFSDELAEGKQRTCSFLIDKGLYSEESMIFHKYAQITNIFPDRNLGRVSITYNIDIPVDFNKDEQEKLKNLLKFTYYRAHKLDEERRYTKYYSEILKVFKTVSVVYNFTKNHIPIDIELKQIIFEDKYPIPGELKVVDGVELETIFTKKDENYNIEKIINSIITIT
ncbi:HD domain-containing protein [Flavobacterium sp. DSP2-3-1]|uniref:HD domain-containing protein n=1 Tax=Flavobacterium sp. DSP2-3-1 TaxID=2804620 RepID=UPI003CEB00FB